MNWLKQLFGGASGSGARNSHTFPADLNTTKCPACDIPYSITTFLHQIKGAYPSPAHGEPLKINCSECNHVASWIYRGEWDEGREAKTTYRVLCVRIIGPNAPTGDEIMHELERIKYQYADVNPFLEQMDLGDCNALVGSIGTSNINSLIQELQVEHFPQGCCCVAINMLAQLLTMINFPEAGVRGVFELDVQPGSNLPTIRSLVKSQSQHVAQKLGPNEDIRHLLAGASRHRRGLFLSGSPGWRESPDRQHQSPNAVCKNDASLDATLNDGNAVFHLFHSLTEDDYLPGLVAGFLIRQKEPLMKMLRLIPFDADAHGNSDVLSPLITEKGLITFDTRLFGSVMNQARATIIGGAGIGFGETVVERLRSNSSCDSPSGQYAVVYYSGHGSVDGDMQIERNVAITPEEICEASRATGVPYLIIVDMCYSSRFGIRYREALRRHDWNGMVMCANSDSFADGLSYECPLLAVVRRPYWRFNILNAEWSKGRGIYTTALTLAMHQLRELEVLSQSPVNITVAEFNEHMLRPICDDFAALFNVPKQQPTLFHYP